MKLLQIQSTDNTDVLIAIDKIQYVIQKKDCCMIGLDNGDCIRTSATFYDLKCALKG